MNKNGEKTLEVQAVADRLRVSVSTIYRLINSGQLPHRKLGPKKAIRVLERDIVIAERYGFDPYSEK